MTTPQPPAAHPEARGRRPALAALPAPWHRPRSSCRPATRAYLNNPKPSYPAIQQAHGRARQVVLRVLIGTDGARRRSRSTSPAVTSAWTNWDAVMRWRFVPGKRNGVPEAMWNPVPVNFFTE